VIYFSVYFYSGLPAQKRKGNLITHIPLLALWCSAVNAGLAAGMAEKPKTGD
jgi:hypothetical protein